MSSGGTLIRPVAGTQDEAQTVNLARPAHNLALGYLRGFLVVLVLAHHSVLAYIDGPPQAKSLLVQPPYWRAFMVVDHQHWAGFGLFIGFNDDFFMSLMFLLSGLFVWSSLKRKGNASFVRDRVRRLGIPFLFAAAIVAPIAYYPSYLLTTGSHSVAGYVHDWLSFGDWPTGPAWFIWLLLAFDLCVDALYALMPNFGDAIGRLASNARLHPVRFFLLLIAASAAVFIPMLSIFGLGWTSVGPFQFQTARLFHYAVYFLAGIGVGAYGIDRGLLASDGILARHWLRWTIGMLVVFAVSVVFALTAISKGTTIPRILLYTVGGAIFALTCGAISFAFLALFVRFATRRRWIWDSLSDNEYGMYIIHYMFVSWLQLAILSSPLPAIAKGLLVFAGVLLLSWGASAAIRRIPAVSRIV
jgi:surface polysaccharide O-acyltransferase-like enzyme